MSRFANPVLLKELKLRFRSFKSISGLIFYLAVLVVFVLGFLLLSTQFRGKGFFTPSDSFSMFVVITMLQMGLVMFITPALTAGAISTEREKQTLNILLTTTQTSTQIIIGKLLSSIAFLLLMVIAGLPLYSIVFLFGGVAPSQLIIILFLYLLTVVAIGSVGIMFSTITKKTIVSMIATYGTMIFLGGITLFLIFIGYMSATASQSSSFAPFTYLWFSINPSSVMMTILYPDIKNEIAGVTGISFPITVVYVIVYLIITVLALFIAIRKLRANMKHNR